MIDEDNEYIKLLSDSYSQSRKVRTFFRIYLLKSYFDQQDINIID